MNRQPPELLAPAGDWEAMRAAVANGADAVYFGLDQFNARHRATNFTLAELPDVMTFLHRHNVRGLLTFNTLIFSDELPAAVEYLTAVAAAGVDALIVQDLGVAMLAHRLCPSLPIHGSTQMTLTEPRGIAFVRQLGVKRVVLARELGLTEIGKIAAATDIPLEVFVHGALCVAYSGQCLTSESLGGRSANRGQCAQACRLPYELVVDGTVKDLGDKAYLLSPSDLAAYELIGDLTALGVASFKIEGRLKSAHYVAATCQTYRAAIDAATSNPNSEISNLKFEISDAQKHDLEQTFSRGFTHGFLSGVNHQELVAARFPKARGTRIGTVSARTPRGVTVTIEPPRLAGPLVGPRPTATIGHGANLASHLAEPLDLIKPGDGVVFDEGHPEQDEQGGRIFAVHRRENLIELQFRPGDVNLAYINPGAIVWKTDDPAIKRRLEHSFARDEVAHRRRLDFVLRAIVGEHLELTGRPHIAPGLPGISTASTREAAARWEDKPLEKATKFPLTIAIAREQLARLGETPFELGEVTLESRGDPMVPKSILNDLRRRVCEQLMRQNGHEIAEPQALDAMRQAIEKRTTSHESRTTNLYILVRTMDQLAAVLTHAGPIQPAMLYADFEDVRRYPAAIDACRAKQMPIALATLRIVKPGEEGFLKQVSDCRPDALLVRSLAAVRFYQEKAPHLPLIGDYALNIANELTAALFASTGGGGLVRMVPSYDLNWTQLAAMLGRFDPARFEVVIHQHMPMFHMEHCVFAHTLSNGKDYRDCGRPCDRHRVDLKDRKGEPHPLIPDVGCRNTVFNAQAQTAVEYVPRMKELGITHFRVELLRESAAETSRIMDRYTRVVAGLEKPMETLRSLRVLNQLGVTRGTLAHE